MKNSAFGFERPEDSPGFLLWQTTMIWQRFIKKALDSYDISHAQFVILAVMLWFENKNQSITQSLVIRQSKLDKMTVSKSFHKLASSGYVKRSENKEDTRAKNVCLTKKGKELTEKLVPMIEKVDEKFFDAIKKTEQRSLIQILNYLISDVDE